MRAIVEQLPTNRQRTKYDESLEAFVETGEANYYYERGFNHYYGWLEGFGTPPHPHYDAIILSDNILKLGKSIEVKVIGVFTKSNNDYKFVCIELSSSISADSLEELNETIRNELWKLYPKPSKGEEWLDRIKALEILNINS